ncbi:MFS transporter [Pseudomonas sp. J237]|nr:MULTISPECIES: MFS transporter [Pseudomonas]OEO26055.1 MFS transporter [Pseudomonas sp. J237]
MLGLTRAFGALYLACMLMQLGSSLLMTYLALRLNASGGAAVWSGALMAANALGMVLGARLGHTLIDRVGHIRTYVACAGVIAAGVLAHAFSENMGVWLMLRLLVGVAMMCQLMVLESWLNECSQNHQRGSVMAIYMLSTYVGMMLGQLALSINGDLGINALLGVAMAFALCLVPVALTGSIHPTPHPPAPVVIRHFLHRVPQSLATVLVSGMINGSFYGLAAIYASEQGLDTAQIGLFMALTIGTGLLAQLPLGLLSDRFPRASLIRLVAVMLTLACLPMAIIHELSMTALIGLGILIGCLQFCLYPLGVALANDNIEAHLRVSLAGILLITFGLGSAVGPLIAGVVMASFGASSLYYFFTGCAAFLAVLVTQRKVTGVYLQDDAPLQHQATPSGLASSTLAAQVEPVIPDADHDDRHAAAPGAVQAQI